MKALHFRKILKFILWVFLLVFSIYAINVSKIPIDKAFCISLTIRQYVSDKQMTYY